jgi:GntR family transcriptional regulator / MocR family aminotransferase
MHVLKCIVQTILSALSSIRFGLAVVTPSNQFPSGVLMSPQRREALLNLSVKRGFWIVEDDYDGEFGMAGKMSAALRAQDVNDSVIYVGTFSKTIFPSIRLGYILCPHALKGALLKAKSLLEGASSGVDQKAMAHFMRTGAFARHLRRASVELQRRRRALHDGIKKHCGGRLRVEDSGAGMHSIGWLPGLSSDQFKALMQTAARRGLGLYSIGPHYVTPPRENGLLLGFASLSSRQIGEAVKLLGECLIEAVSFDAHSI